MVAALKARIESLLAQYLEGAITVDECHLGIGAALYEHQLAFEASQ